MSAGPEEEKRTVKRKLTVLFGMLGLAVAIGVSSLGRAQNPPAPGGGPTLQTRIALINLAQVFKGYQKVTNFANENKQMLQPYQDKAKTISVQIEAHTKALEQKDLQEARRAELEKNRTAYTRQMEDLSNEAKLLFTKKNEEQMLIVYKEVMDAAQRYAVSHGYELVMHYNDVPTSSPEFYSAGNVSRKIQAGACIPMYTAPGMDITDGVIQMLNQFVNRGQAAAPQR
jgi:Skp family chaperone for outer membrane proteins